MRIQLKKYVDGRMKSSGTYAREAFAKSRATSGVTVRAFAAARAVQRVLSVPSVLTLHELRFLQLGERAMPKSSAQYTMQDLEVSSDTDESFLGAPASCVRAHAHRAHEHPALDSRARAALRAQPLRSACSACWRWRWAAARCSFTLGSARFAWTEKSCSCSEARDTPDKRGVLRRCWNRKRAAPILLAPRAPSRFAAGARGASATCTVPLRLVPQASAKRELCTYRACGVPAFVLRAPTTAWSCKLERLGECGRQPPPTTAR
jgi:hypothetical protein